MRKLSVLLIAVILGSFSAAYAVKTVKIDPLVQSGISKYKAGNYLGAMQDIKQAVSINPKDSMAQYYLGNLLIKMGKKDAAKKAYEEVLIIGDNQALMDYSYFAVGCIAEIDKKPEVPKKPEPDKEQKPEQPSEPPKKNPCDRTIFDSQGDLDAFVRSGQFLHPEAKGKIQDEQLKGIQNTINSGSKAVEFSNYRYLNDASGAMPSDEEIANAVKTLARAGFNPLNAYGNSPQHSQMSAFLGQSNSNNSPMNMMPLIMAQGSGEKINPQLIQSMMMSQMMPSYDFSDTNRNRGY